MAAGDAGGPGEGVNDVAAMQTAVGTRTARERQRIAIREAMGNSQGAVGAAGKRKTAQALPVGSNPRIVPVEEANFSSAKPIRWSIETKRFGSG